MKASPKHVIATRSWLKSMKWAGDMPEYRPVKGASMTMSEAWDRYAAGMIETALGRETVETSEGPMVVESYYAIPRKTVRTKRYARWRLA